MAGEVKKRPCLRCDKMIKSTPERRICHDCKNHHKDSSDTCGMIEYPEYTDSLGCKQIFKKKGHS